jgi:hypothetical protein
MNEDISLLNHKFDSLNEVVSDMKLALKELTTAITKLTLIEERQSHAAAAQERAFASIERIENRLKALEYNAPNVKKVSVWLDRATFASIGLIVMLLLKKSGLL